MPAVPQRGLAGLLLSTVGGYDGVVKAVGPGVALPLSIDQALRGAALFALAHPVVGGGGRHPIVAEVAAQRVGEGDCDGAVCLRMAMHLRSARNRNVRGIVGLAGEADNDPIDGIFDPDVGMRVRAHVEHAQMWCFRCDAFG